MRRALPWLVGLAVVAVAAVAFDAPFTYDDRIEVVGNAAVRHEKWWLACLYYNPWRVLLLYSYALNWRLGGLDPRGYHAISIAIHAVNAILAWRLAGRLLSPRRAILAAALWALHPMTTEGVSYIAGRSDALVATFMLAATAAWIDDCRTPNRRARAIAWVAAALAALTKEVAACLPVLLLAAEFFLVAGANWRLVRWRRYAPFAAIGLGSALMRFGLAGWPVPEVPRTLSAHVFTQADAWSRYLLLWLVPWGLSILHPLPAQVTLRGALCALSWTGMFVFAARKKGLGAFGLALWALPLAVSSAFVLKETMAEHRAYLAGFGVALVAASKLPERAWTTLLPAALAALTVHRNLVWRDEVALWAGAAAQWPESADAAYGHGDAARLARRWSEAEEAYLRSALLDPGRAEAWVNVGICRVNRDDDAGAREAWSTALRIEPRNCSALNNLAGLALKGGDIDAAAQGYTGTLRACPDDANAHFKLGMIWAPRDPVRARFHLGESLRIVPEGPQAEQAREAIASLGG